MLSEWITPSREPLAAYTFETAPLEIGLSEAIEGAESSTLISQRPHASPPTASIAPMTPTVTRNGFFLRLVRRCRLRDRALMVREGTQRYLKPSSAAPLHAGRLAPARAAPPRAPPGRRPRRSPLSPGASNPRA